MIVMIWLEDKNEKRYKSIYIHLHKHVKDAIIITLYDKKMYLYFYIQYMPR